VTLEKATIERYIPGGESVDVLFNPTEYQLSQSNQFAEVAVPGLGAPLLQFGRGNARTLSMQLFFDTYEQRTDVRQHTRKINYSSPRDRFQAPRASDLQICLGRPDLHWRA
jgi:hypothetical protein